MKINHIYNKSVTCLEPGETVSERYSGSNAGFAIFKTIKLPKNTTIVFSQLKDFEWIDWGDNSDPYLKLAEGHETAQHIYSTADGETDFTIVVYGIKNLGRGSSSTTSITNIFTGDLITTAYFGEGVSVWGDPEALWGFHECSKLTKIKNLSQCPKGFIGVTNDLSKHSIISNIIFNIDCTEISDYGLSSTRYNMNFLEIPERINILKKGAFFGVDKGENRESNPQILNILLPKNLKYLGENSLKSDYIKIFYKGDSSNWSEIEKDVNGIGTSEIYFYSEVEPTSASNKLWHYADGEPVIWTKE